MEIRSHFLMPSGCQVSTHGLVTDTNFRAGKKNTPSGQENRVSGLGGDLMFQVNNLAKGLPLGR